MQGRELSVREAALAPLRAHGAPGFSEGEWTVLIEAPPDAEAPADADAP